MKTHKFIVNACLFRDESNDNNHGISTFLFTEPQLMITAGPGLGPPPGMMLTGVPPPGVCTWE